MDYNGRNILFVCLLAFIEGMTFILSSDLSFKKYEYDSILGGYRCGLAEIVFKTDGEFDLTGKLLDLDSMCESVHNKFQTDCLHILERRPSAESGVYKIALWKSTKAIPVFCDMDADGGGWTVFQNRFDGSIDFYRKFSEYENGFGAPDGEFWLGLKYIQEITSQGATEIRLEMKRNNSEEGYETYKDFKLLDGTNYTLSIDGNSGQRSAGISRRSLFDSTVHNTIGYPFSTYDRDKDYDRSKSLAIERHGAWWYASGTAVNPNGRYCQPGTVCKDHTNGWSGHTHIGFASAESLKSSRMLIRRV